MNKSIFYLSLLKYFIKNPKNGVVTLQSKFESLNKRKSQSSEKIQDMDMINALHLLFPNNSLSLNDLQNELNELNEHKKNFFKKIENLEYPSKEKPYPANYSMDDKSNFFIYALCRITKPNIIVETGVAYGLSSMYILHALHKNSIGKLYSFDSIFRPWESKKMIGSIIPDELKANWEFINERSSDKLKPLLNKIGKVDIFIHDSLHTYRNMMYEFKTAWPFIKNNGFLISDDISDNNAFADFCTQNITNQSITVKQEGISKSSLGVIQK